MGLVSVLFVSGCTSVEQVPRDLASAVRLQAVFAYVNNNTPKIVIQITSNEGISNATVNVVLPKELNETETRLESSEGYNESINDTGFVEQRMLYFIKNSSAALGFGIPASSISSANFEIALKALDDMHNISINISTSEGFELLSNASYFLHTLKNGSTARYKIQTIVTKNGFSGGAHAYVTWLQESDKNNSAKVCMVGEVSYTIVYDEPVSESPTAVSQYARSGGSGGHGQSSNGACECRAHQDCAHNEICNAGFCDKFECPQCYHYEKHACVKDECCIDEDCMGHLRCINSRCVDTYQLACDDNNKCTIDSYKIINETPRYECVYETVSPCCGNGICESGSRNIRFTLETKIGAYNFESYCPSAITIPTAMLTINNETKKVIKNDTTTIGNVRVHIPDIYCGGGKEEDLDAITLDIELENSELCPIDCSK